MFSSSASSRKRMSTETVIIRDPNSNAAGGAAGTIKSTLEANPDYLTEKDASLPRVLSVRTSNAGATVAPDDDSVNILVIVLPVVLGTLLLAGLIIFLVWFCRKRRFDDERTKMTAVPMNPSYLKPT